MINNQSGALTLDFIFALILVISMTFLLGLFSFTLSVVEGIQYLAFSSSRAYYAGHLSISDQESAAQKKFDQLSKAGAYPKLLKKDWFNVTIAGIGKFGELYETEDPKDILEGVRAKVEVGILNQNIPFFGTTEGEAPFVTYVTSFLGRESTTEECMAVIQDRVNRMMQVDGLSAASSYINPEQYAVYDDNGC